MDATIKTVALDARPPTAMTDAPIRFTHVFSVMFAMPRIVL
jgi:hypothetical protein